MEYPLIVILTKGIFICRFILSLDRLKKLEDDLHYNSQRNFFNKHQNTFDRV